MAMVGIPLASNPKVFEGDSFFRNYETLKVFLFGTGPSSVVVIIEPTLYAIHKFVPISERSEASESDKTYSKCFLMVLTYFYHFETLSILYYFFPLLIELYYIIDNLNYLFEKS